MKKKLTPKQKAIKIVGKKVFNKIHKEVKEIRERKTDTPQENFDDIKDLAIKYHDKGTDNKFSNAYHKLVKDEIKNFVRSEENKIKKLHKKYSEKMQDLGGSELKFASKEFKNELMKIQKEQIVINTLLRPIKTELQAKSKFELKYNPNTDEATNYKAWEQAEFEKEVLGNPYITTINGLDKKTDLAEIMDLINEMYSRMDSTKLFCIRNLKEDGKVKLFIAEETDIDENENEY